MPLSQDILTQIIKNAITHLNLSNQELTQQELLTLAAALAKNTSITHIDLSFTQIGVHCDQIYSSLLLPSETEKSSIAITAKTPGYVVQSQDDLARATLSGPLSYLSKNTPPPSKQLIREQVKHAFLVSDAAWAKGEEDTGLKVHYSDRKNLKEALTWAYTLNIIRRYNGEREISVSPGTYDNYMPLNITQLHVVAEKQAADLITRKRAELDASRKTLANALANLPNLISLNLSHCNLGDEGISIFATHLFPGFFSKLFVAKHSPLKHLQLKNNQCGPKGASALKNIYRTQITELDLSDNPLGENGGTSLISSFQNIVRLNLSNTDLGDKAAGEVAKLISNGNVRYLNLAANSFTHKGANKISTSLVKNDQLLSLNISNAIYPPNNLLHDAEALAKIANANTYLRYLNISGIRQTTQSAKIILAALQTNSTLRKLKLASLTQRSEQTFYQTNQPGKLEQEVIEAQAIAGLIRKNQLIKLNLNHNYFDAEDGSIFTETLANNHSITALKISYPGILPHAVGSIFRILRKSNTLAKLDLTDVNYEQCEFELLLAALKVNCSLTHLVLGFSTSSNFDSSPFIECIKNNYALTKITTPITDDSSEGRELALTLQRNIELRDNFHEAAKFGKTALLQMLITRGVSLLSTTGIEKNTVLHWAILYKQLSVIKILVNEYGKRGINANILLNKDLLTPLELAHLFQDKAIVALIYSISQPLGPETTSENQEPIETFNNQTKPSATTSNAYASITKMSGATLFSVSSSIEQPSAPPLEVKAEPSAPPLEEDGLHSLPQPVIASNNTTNNLPQYKL